MLLDLGVEPADQPGHDRREGCLLTDALDGGYAGEPCGIDERERRHRRPDRQVRLRQVVDQRRHGSSVGHRVVERDRIDDPHVDPGALEPLPERALGRRQDRGGPAAPGQVLHGLRHPQLRAASVQRTSQPDAADRLTGHERSAALERSRDVLGQGGRGGQPAR